VFADGVRESMTLTELATDAGWTVCDGSVSYSPYHFCPAHAADGRRA